MILPFLVVCILMLCTCASQKGTIELKGLNENTYKNRVYILRIKATTGEHEENQERKWKSGISPRKILILDEEIF